MSKPSISESDILCALQILYQNGIAVTNARQAYHALTQYEENPQFCQILSAIFASEQSIVGTSLPASWAQFRQIAGITLKNNLKASKSVSPQVLLEAGRVALNTLRGANNVPILRTAAQIVVKITLHSGFGWWGLQPGLGNLEHTLLHELLRSSNLYHVMGALFTLQYLIEDVPEQLGAAVETVLIAIGELVSQRQLEFSVKKAAFRTMLTAFEAANGMEWNVVELAPMQRGMCSASVHVVRCCTQLIDDPHVTGDSGFVPILFRCLSLLLDYMSYFFPAIPEEEGLVVCGKWTMFAASRAIHPQHNREECAAAIDFLAHIMEIFESSAGEGYVAAFAPLLEQQFPLLIPKLMEYMIISDEEFQAIDESDSYLHRDAFSSGSASPGGSIEENTAMDEDEAAATLRRCACFCLNQCCLLNELVVFPILLREMTAKWVSSDWRVREAAVMACGVAAESCAQQMQAHLPNVIPTLVQHFILDASQHYCVVSMSMWTLSKTFHFLFSTTEGQAMFPHAIPCLLQRLPSESKRIQNSAVTAILCLLNRINEYDVPLPKEFIADLIRQVHLCLPVYHTTNLNLLCNVAMMLLATQPDDVVDGLIQPFFERRPVLMGLFETTYGQCYVQCQSTVIVNKDIFAVDRAINAFFLRRPSHDQSHVTAVLDTWATVIVDICHRMVYDDADLIYGSLYATAGFVSVSTTEALALWYRGRCGDVLFAAVEILAKATPHDIVRSGGLQLITNLCRVLREEIFSNLSNLLDMVLALLESFVGEATHDPKLLSQVGQVVSQIVQIQSQPTPRTMHVFLQCASKLRHDSFGQSFDHFTALARHVCAAMDGGKGGLLAHLPASTISKILAEASNGVEKAEACRVYAAAVCSCQDPQVLSGLMENSIRMVFSWQSTAAQYSGLLPALTAMVHHLAKVCGVQMQRFLSSYGETFSSTFCAAYQL
jgi:hypothetical protein